MTIALAFWCLVTASCVFLMSSKDVAVRLGGGLYLAVSILSAVAQSFAPRWNGINWGLFACDAFYLTCLLYLAHRTRRFWPIWASGFQLLSIITVVAIALSSSASAGIYRGLETVWAVPILIILLIGAQKDKNIGRAYRQA